VTAPQMTIPPSAYDGDHVIIKDFTIKEKRIAFRIDDDVFEAYGVLGVPLLQELVEMSEGLSKMVSEKKYDGIFDIFGKILYPDSAKRFKERGLAIGDDAIDVRRQVLPILHYLLEKYGVRPTQPSSSSSTGSPDEIDGTSSTLGSEAAVSALTT
jgi:hypothetical protein